GSPLAALWKDEAVQAFMEKPRAAWAAWMDETRKEHGITPDDVFGLLSGQAAVGIAWKEGSDGYPILLGDIGENEEKLRAIVAQVEKLLLEERGFKRDEEEFRGVKIVSYRKEGEGDGEGPGGSWLLDGRMLAVAEDAETLKDVLVRKDRRDEGTLAAREIYTRTRGRVGGRSADIFFYFDVPNLMKALAQGDDAPDEKDRMVMAALGIDSIEALAFEGSLSAEAIAWRGFLGVKGAKTGLLKLVDGKNSTLAPAAYTPPDAMSASALTLDVQALWEEVRRIADRMEEGTTKNIDAWFDTVKLQLGVDIPGDLIGTLGHELTYHVKLQENPVPMPFPIPPFTLGIQLKDKERFEAAHDNLIAALAPGLATQEYLGVKMRTVATPLGTPAIAVLPDRVLVSMEPDDLQEAIARYGKEAKGLVDREDVAAALAALPPQRFAVSAEDLPKAFKEGSIALQLALATASGVRVVQGGRPVRLGEVIDPSKFPSEEVLRKYLGVGTSCLINEDDGLTILSFIHLKG
ncbi:MAG TPA: DUF3352 domain-containing protein, partial [Vicinamibacteria bacterium]